MRACMPETVASGIASVGRAAPSGVGAGVALARRPMSSVSWSIAHDARRAQAVERVAAADDDERADVRAPRGERRGGGRSG